MRAAVVGGGVSGLAAAGELARAGASVTVFDKGRRPAGRVSTRRAEPFAFDHGAQYFTARSPAFAATVEAWRRAGVVAPWTGALVSFEGPGSAPSPLEDDELRWVGTPGMSAVAKHLAEGLDVRASLRVTTVEPVGAGWELVDETGTVHGPFDALVVALPAAQAAALLPEAHPLRPVAAAVEMGPCWAAMLGLAERYAVPFDGAFVNGGALSWIARNSSKPGRPRGEAWVLHAAPGWSTERLHHHPDTVGAALVSELEALTGAPPRGLERLTPFLWRYSRREGPPPDRSPLVETTPPLALCGDWVAGLRVEGAWTSGVEAARALLATWR